MKIPEKSLVKIKPKRIFNLFSKQCISDYFFHVLRTYLGVIRNAKFWQRYYINNNKKSKKAQPNQPTTTKPTKKHPKTSKQKIPPTKQAPNKTKTTTKKPKQNTPPKDKQNPPNPLPQQTKKQTKKENPKGENA